MATPDAFQVEAAFAWVDRRVLAIAGEIADEIADEIIPAALTSEPVRKVIADAARWRALVEYGERRMKH